MKSATLKLELDDVELEVEVGYHYYPPEDPGAYGYRVPPDIEISVVNVTAFTIDQGTFKRHEIDKPAALDLQASNWISDHWEKYKELLIHEARS